MRRLARVLAAISLLNATHAQALNIAFGPVGQPGPSDQYGAAAGQVGRWNAVASGASGPLVRIDGRLTPAVIDVPGSELNFDNPSTTGDDEALLDSLTDPSGILTSDVCSFGSECELSNLENGTYDVFVYAWAPDAPVWQSLVCVVGGLAGRQVCGGAGWGGMFVNGVHFVSDRVTVRDGTLTVRITQFVLFASFNGLQIVPVCDEPVANYCTAKSGLTCGQPAMSASGTPSASRTSGFLLDASPVRSDQLGLFLYTDQGRANTPFDGGILCLASPTQRSVAVHSGGAAACEGALAIDWASFAHGLLGGEPKPFLLLPGTIVQVQAWGRDSMATGSLLADALEYVVCE